MTHEDPICKTCPERQEHYDGSLTCIGTIYCPHFEDPDFGIPKPSKKILFIDTETTGMPEKGSNPAINPRAWPWMVEIAWILADEEGNTIRSYNHLIIPEKYSIPAAATAIHGITTERAREEGVAISDAMTALKDAAEQADLIVGHNVDFDLNVIIACESRHAYSALPINVNSFCTMKNSTELCQIPSPYGGYKWPKLTELYTALFGKEPDQEHRALPDVELTKECFFEMVKRGIASCP